MNLSTEKINRMKEILGLKREIVGVKFANKAELESLRTNFDDATKTRYCQALMRAIKGEKIIINAENISCPASAAAFGLKPLPDKLSTGQMLYNMGFFASPEAGKNAMAGMTRLEQGSYDGVVVFPLKDMVVVPDVVVVESLPEHLMWIALASIYETGERLDFSSAIFQATCVDSTVIPFVSNKINSSLGCYGCRDATDMKLEENLIGIPFAQLENIIDNLEELAKNPITKARAKQAFHSFSACEGGE